jgi:hypothetical protein
MAHARRRLTITINQMDERAHLKHEAGTSLSNDGTTVEKSHLLEEQRIAPSEQRIARSLLHDSLARAQTCLCGDNVDSVTKQERDACKKPP